MKGGVPGGPSSSSMTPSWTTTTRRLAAPPWKLLEAAGFQVVLADNACCGRPMVSKGMLERARDHARINVDRLYPYAKAGIPIVGCEPSCLLTLRDEYPDLPPRRPIEDSRRARRPSSTSSSSPSTTEASLT